MMTAPRANRIRPGARGIALLIAVAAAAVFAAGAIATAPAAQAPKQAGPPSSASCEGCHTGIEPMHENVALGCVECHGGDGAQTEKAKAHGLPRNKELGKSSAN